MFAHKPLGDISFNRGSITPANDTPKWRCRYIGAATEIHQLGYNYNANFLKNIHSMRCDGIFYSAVCDSFLGDGKSYIGSDRDYDIGSNDFFHD